MDLMPEETLDTDELYCGEHSRVRSGFTSLFRGFVEGFAVLGLSLIWRKQ